MSIVVIVVIVVSRLSGLSGGKLIMLCLITRPLDWATL